MKKFFIALFIFGTVAGTVHPPAEAKTPLQTIGATCGKRIGDFSAAHADFFRPLIAFIVKTQVKDLSGPGPLTLHNMSDPKASEFKLELEKRMNFGMVGAIYSIKSVSGLPQLESWLDQGYRLIAKLPHRLKYFGPPKKKSVAFANESQIYNNIVDALPEIEQDKAFPKEPAWENGKVPTAPLLVDVVTEEGHLFIKPFVNGQDLKDMFKSNPPKSPADLPPEVVKGIREIYDFAQAAYNVAVRHSAHPEQVQGIDLNPPNLVWITDPVELKKFGLKRPGFTTYEFGQFDGFRAMTFEAYLEAVVAYIRSRA